VPLAYLVIAHTAPEQVARLVDRIAAPDDVVLVHVDRKAPVEPFARAFAGLDVTPAIVRPRISVHWGGYGTVKVALRGIRMALADPRPWSHFVVLSGADYPIRSSEEIHAFFAAHEEQSYLSWSAGDGVKVPDAQRAGNATWNWTGDRERLDMWTVSIRGRRWHFTAPPHPLPPGLRTPYQGSAWVNLSRAAARHCLRFARRRPDAGLFWRTTIACDEFAFQTMVMNSPLRDMVVNEDLRYMNWAGNSPPLLTLDDLPGMLASDKLFARKLDLATHPELYDALDERALVA
jgi:hypothetical protein